LSSAYFFQDWPVLPFNTVVGLASVCIWPGGLFLAADQKGVIVQPYGILKRALLGSVFFYVQDVSG
jgi:hypothetical protein